MCRKIVLILGLISLNFVAFSQTKWIWHKSHSGSKSSFKTSLYHNLFDIGESNFGMAPRMDVCMARLDTLEFLNDSTTIVKTSAKVEEYWGGFYNQPKEMREIAHLWKPGADTVVNHGLFNKKVPEDTIKKVLKEKYNFKNNIDKVVIIDKEESPSSTEDKKRNSAPVIINDDGGSNNYLGGILFVLVAVVLSIILAIYSKKKRLS